MDKKYKDLLVGIAIVSTVGGAVWLTQSPEERQRLNSPSVDLNIEKQFNEKYINEAPEVKRIKEKIKTTIYTKEEKEVFKKYMSFSAKYPVINDKSLCLESYNKECFDKALNKEVLNKITSLNKINNKDYELLALLSENKIINTEKEKSLKEIEMTESFYQSMMMQNFDILKLIELRKDEEAIKLFEKINKEKINLLKNANTMIFKMTMLETLKNDAAFAKLVKEQFNIDFKLIPITKKDASLSLPLITELEIGYNLTKQLNLKNKSQENYLEKIMTERMETLNHYMLLNTDDALTYKTKHKTVPYNTSLDPLIIKGAPYLKTLLDLKTPDFSYIRDDIKEYNEKI